MEKKLERRNVAFKAESVKVDESTGILRVSGYASVFGNIDSYGDVVDKGSFVEHLEKSGNRVRLCYNHNRDLVIGKIVELKEDEKGLFMVADVLPTTLGKDVQILLEHEALNEFSIGYYVKDAEFEVEDGISIFHLKTIELIEVSVVSRAANEEAVVTALEKKSDLGQSIKTLSDAELAKLKASVDSEFSQRIVNNLK